MSDIVCCPLSNGDPYATPACWSEKIRRARKQHRCGECGEAIVVGVQYEYASGIWDGSASSHKTCMSCVEIRNHFSCGEGWVYGEVWSQLEENFFPDMKAGGPCMEGLSPAAKQRLFDERMKWYEETNE